MYALPALVALDVVSGELTRERVRDWLLSAVVFFAVWESIEALKPFADFTGPGTRGQLLGGFSGSQVGNLLDRFNYQPGGALVERLTRVGPELLAWFAGASQVDTSLPLGDRPWLLRVAGLCLLLAAGRLAWLTLSLDAVTGRNRRWIRSVRDRIARAPFAWYLLGVGRDGRRGVPGGETDSHRLFPICHARPADSRRPDRRGSGAGIAPGLRAG